MWKVLGSDQNTMRKWFPACMCLSSALPCTSLFCPKVTNSVHSLLLSSPPTDSGLRNSLASSALSVPMPSHWDKGFADSLAHAWLSRRPFMFLVCLCLLVDIIIYVRVSLVIEQTSVLATGSGLLLFLTRHLDNILLFFLEVSDRLDGSGYFRSDCFLLVPGSSENCGLKSLSFLPYGLWEQNYPSRKCQSL